MSDNQVRKLCCMKSRKCLIVSLVLFILLVYGWNTSLLAPKGSRPFLLAHRGLAQTFPMDGIQWDTNTAERIYPPEHPYLENTIDSMRAAFDFGADMVELDVQVSKDGQLAVFHDHRLDYRSDGHGSIADFTMEELKHFDIGYAYTADNGKTYPFRGKGVALMPSLQEVLDSFPHGAFLIHLKNADPEEGKALALFLMEHYPERISNLAVYGSDLAVEEVASRLPEIRVFSMKIAKKSLIPYLLVGWTGYVPQNLRNSVLYLPLRYARFLWGWPHRFVYRMKVHHTQFILVNGNGKWSEGFDSLEDISKLPKGYSGGIWTNRIDILGFFYNK